MGNLPMPSFRSTLQLGDVGRWLPLSLGKVTDNQLLARNSRGVDTSRTLVLASPITKLNAHTSPHQL